HSSSPPRRSSDLVLEDADLEMAARAAVWAGFVTSGQVCSRVGRVFVVSEVAERFMSAVAREAGQVRHGPLAGDGIDVGPLAGAGGVEQVRTAVGEALA